MFVKSIPFAGTSYLTRLDESRTPPLVHAELCGNLKDRLQLIDRSWETLTLRLFAFRRQKRRQSTYISPVSIICTHAVEPDFDDHFNILFKRTLESIRMATLHCPKRLEEKKLLHQVANQ